MRLMSLARGGALAGVALASALFPQDSVGLVTLTVLALLCLSTTEVVSLRNLAVAHLYLLLGVGPYLIPMVNQASVQWLACGLFGAFLSGLVMRKLLDVSNTKVAASAVSPPSRSKTPQDVGSDSSSPRILLASVIAQLVVLLLSLRQYGVARYLSGVSLAERISGYAETGALDTIGILSLLTGVLTTACVGAYVARAEPGRKYAWSWLIGVLVVLPLLRLDRSALVVGIIGLVFLASRQRCYRNGRSLTRVLVLVVSVLIALGSAFGIGMLRSGALTGPRAADSGPLSLVVGEASPVRVISDAILPGAPRYGGDPILAPMVTRFVPPTLLPEKPENTTTRYMLGRDAQAYRSGYMLAPSALGAVILNFGTVAAIGGAFVMGHLLAARRDLGELPSGLLVILFLSAYPLMRNDPANSVPSVVLALILYAILRGRSPKAQLSRERRREVSWAAL